MTDYLAMLRKRLHPQKEGFVTFGTNPDKALRRVEVSSGTFGTDHSRRFCWAEGLARLDPTQPPENVLPRRWVQFINDCHRFVRTWAPQATALGWEPLDLIGCDALKPYSRVDRQGLLWLLNGRRVIAMTAEAATIEGAGGGRLAYRRESKNGRILAWELLCF